MRLKGGTYLQFIDGDNLTFDESKQCILTKEDNPEYSDLIDYILSPEINKKPLYVIFKQQEINVISGFLTRYDVNYSLVCGDGPLLNIAVYDGTDVTITYVLY